MRVCSSGVFYLTALFHVFCAKLGFLGVKLRVIHLVELLSFFFLVRYTLWNAEYRMSLMRNLDISPCGARGSDCEVGSEVKGGGEEHGELEVVSDMRFKDVESCSSSSSLRALGDLPPQALTYIQQLQSELTDLKEVTLLFIYFIFVQFTFFWVQ